MEPRDGNAERSPEFNGDAPPEPVDLEPAPRLDLMSGAAGAAVAIAASGLLVLGLWAIARDAPSAATDPRLIPPPTAVATPAPRQGQSEFTLVPTEAPTAEAADGAQ